jgi:hypothetical protein
LPIQVSVAGNQHAAERFRASAAGVQQQCQLGGRHGPAGRVCPRHVPDPPQHRPDPGRLAGEEGPCRGRGGDRREGLAQEAVDIGEDIELHVLADERVLVTVPG